MSLFELVQDITNKRDASSAASPADEKWSVGDRAYLEYLTMPDRGDLYGQVVHLRERFEDARWRIEVASTGESLVVNNARAFAQVRPDEVEKRAVGEVTVRLAPVKAGRRDLNGRPVRLCEWVSASCRVAVELLEEGDARLSVRLNRLETPAVGEAVHESYMQIRAQAAQQEREELRAIASMPAGGGMAADRRWYLIDLEWLRRWRGFFSAGERSTADATNAAPASDKPSDANEGGGRQATPPGPIDNERIAAALTGTSDASALKLGLDYVAVNAATWALLTKWYGGGPPLVRTTLKQLHRDGSQITDEQERAATTLARFDAAVRQRGVSKEQQRAVEALWEYERSKRDSDPADLQRAAIALTNRRASEHHASVQGSPRSEVLVVRDKAEGKDEMRRTLVAMQAAEHRRVVDEAKRVGVTRATVAAMTAARNECTAPPSPPSMTTLTQKVAEATDVEGRLKERLREYLLVASTAAEKGEPATRVVATAEASATQALLADAKTVLSESSAQLEALVAEEKERERVERERQETAARANEAAALQADLAMARLLLEEGEAAKTLLEAKERVSALVTLTLTHAHRISPRAAHPSPLTPNSSPLTAHPSLLTPPSSPHIGPPTSDLLLLPRQPYLLPPTLIARAPRRRRRRRRRRPRPRPLPQANQRSAPPKTSHSTGRPVPQHHHRSRGVRHPLPPPPPATAKAAAARAAAAAAARAAAALPRAAAARAEPRAAAARGALQGRSAWWWWAAAQTAV